MFRDCGIFGLFSDYLDEMLQSNYSTKNIVSFTIRDGVSSFFIIRGGMQSFFIIRGGMPSF